MVHRGVVTTHVCRRLNDLNCTHGNSLRNTCCQTSPPWPWRKRSRGQGEMWRRLSKRQPQCHETPTALTLGYIMMHWQMLWTRGLPWWNYNVPKILKASFLCCFMQPWDQYSFITTVQIEINTLNKGSQAQMRNKIVVILIMTAHTQTSFNS